ATSRAARLGKSGAALPCAHDKMLTGRHLRERNIGPFRKDRMILQQWPDLREVVGVDVVDPEDGVRVTHAEDGRRVQDWLVDRPNYQIDRAGILEFLGERDLVPRETWLAHVHGRDQRPVALPAAQQSGCSLQRQGAFAGLLE